MVERSVSAVVAPIPFDWDKKYGEKRVYDAQRLRSTTTTRVE